MNIFYLAQVGPGDTIEIGGDLDPIYVPIGLESIAIAVGVAGATMIGLWATYKIGFRLVRKLVDRMGSVV